MIPPPEKLYAYIILRQRGIEPRTPLAGYIPCFSLRSHCLAIAKLLQTKRKSLKSISARGASQFSQRDYCPCDDKDRSQYIRIHKGFGEAGAEIAKRKPYGFDPPLPRLFRQTRQIGMEYLRASHPIISTKCYICVPYAFRNIFFCSSLNADNARHTAFRFRLALLQNLWSCVNHHEDVFFRNAKTVDFCPFPKHTFEFFP